MINKERNLQDAKKYDAVIEFNVISHPQAAVVWEDTMRLTVYKKKKDKKGAIKQGAASIPEEDVPEAGAEGSLFPWWFFILQQGFACWLSHFWSGKGKKHSMYSAAEIIKRALIIKILLSVLK